MTPPGRYSKVVPYSRSELRGGIAPPLLPGVDFPIGE